MEDDVKSLKSRLLNAMDMPEMAEVEALKSEVADLRTLLEQNKKDFNKAFKSLQEDIKSTMEDALKPVESEAMKSEDEPEAEEDPKVDEEPEETEEEVEEEDESEVEEANEESTDVVAEKGHSKAEPVHDAEPVAEKSKTQNIYAFLGRNPDGTRKLH